MSPFEHGEVFVTDDGAETDLDLGHYERFTGVAARYTDSVSSGRIYSNVWKKNEEAITWAKPSKLFPMLQMKLKNLSLLARMKSILCSVKSVGQ